MKDEIDAAVKAASATIQNGGRQSDTAAAMIALLGLGILALDRIATSLERANEATAMIAARRYSIDNL